MIASKAPCLVWHRTIGDSRERVAIQVRHVPRDTPFHDPLEEYRRIRDVDRVNF